MSFFSIDACKFWIDGQAAEVIDRLTEHVAAIRFICGNLGHNEVRLGEFCSCRVDSNEDLGDRFDIEVFGELDQTNVIVGNHPQLLQDFSDLLSVRFGILGAVIIREVDEVRIRREDIRNVRNPSDVLSDGGIEDFELLLQWMEGNSDSDGRIVLGQDLSTEKTGHQGGHTLLPVDQNSLPS